MQTLVDRGFQHQCTDIDALDARASKGPLTFYIGFDATASCLHVGNLVQVMLLRRAQLAGHKPLIIMGGGTTKIGDPSGKDNMRKILTDEQIDANAKSIQKIFAQYITFGDGPTDAVMLNNDDWLKDLNYLKFLRDYGRHFTINRMLTFESVKGRLDREQPLTFLEFNYMILQGYDFLKLNETHDCILEMGGSDQWGNIINGVELIRRVHQKESYGFTTPLITTASGAKMGKTADGAVWLDKDKLPSFDFWQFWRNTEDDDVARFLKLFTDIPLTEIAELTKEGGAALNDAKVKLADEATRLAHGDAAVAEVNETVNKLYVNKDQPDYEIDGTDANGTPIVKSALPVIQIPAADFPLPAFDLLKRANLCASNGEARRLIQGRGARMNDAVIDDPNSEVTPSHGGDERVLKLSAGKKRHALVQVI